LLSIAPLQSLRRGEAAGLRWRDIDLGTATILICHQLQQYAVVLDRTTAAVLRRHRAAQQAEQAAGLPPVRLHDLRHGAASLAPGRRRRSAPSPPTRTPSGADRPAVHTAAIRRPYQARQRPNQSTVSAGQAGWGGWGSNPGPADYERVPGMLRMHTVDHGVVPGLVLRHSTQLAYRE
jgi:hypothetical protein